jgi:Activator of Hsp90 ATPase homolog 1-like protein
LGTKSLLQIFPELIIARGPTPLLAPLKAEGNSRCVYEIEPTGASAKLTLTHSIERPDSKFIEAVSEGWPMVISNLKSLLETGDVALVYHRGHGAQCA